MTLNPISNFQEVNQKTFMFTIATNGYDEVFKDCLDSHKKYAINQGYKYKEKVLSFSHLYLFNFYS